MTGLGMKTFGGQRRWNKGDRAREERLVLVPRAEAGYIGRRMQGMWPPGRRRGGRPKRRFMDVAREDMQLAG